MDTIAIPARTDSRAASKTVRAGRGCGWRSSWGERIAPPRHIQWMTTRASQPRGPASGTRRGSAIAALLVDELDDDGLRELAGRLRPYLHDDPWRLLDARKAAARLGLHPETLVRMARDGRVWACKAGREWRFRADRLDIRPRRGKLSAAPPPAAPRRARAPGGAAAAAIRGGAEQRGDEPIRQELAHGLGVRGTALGLEIEDGIISRRYDRSAP
jgi:excisionase family DNA binding protein